MSTNKGTNRWRFHVNSGLTVDRMSSGGGAGVMESILNQLPGYLLV